MGAKNVVYEEENTMSMVVPHIVVTCKNKILLICFVY